MHEYIAVRERVSESTGTDYLVVRGSFGEELPLTVRVSRELAFEEAVSWAELLGLKVEGETWL